MAEPGYEVWRADMERLRPQLEPYVIRIEGSDFLSTECPEALATLHASLVSIGYARGFIQ